MDSRWQVAGASVLFVAACSTSAMPTQVVFYLDAEEATQARALQLEVIVWSGMFAEEAGHKMITVSDDPPFEILPATVPIVPRANQRGTVAVEGVLFDDEEERFHRVAAVADFVPDERREIRLVFEDACQNRLCAGAQLCVAGECVDSCFLAEVDSGAVSGAACTEGLSGLTAEPAGNGTPSGTRVSDTDDSERSSYRRRYRR